MNKKEYSDNIRKYSRAYLKDSRFNDIKESEAEAIIKYETEARALADDILNELLKNKENGEDVFEVAKNLLKKEAFERLINENRKLSEDVLKTDKNFYKFIVDDILNKKAKEDKESTKGRISKILYNGKHFAWVAMEIRENFEKWLPKTTIPVACFIQLKAYQKLGGYKIPNELNGKEPLKELDDKLIEYNYKDRAIFLQSIFREAIEECEKDYDGYREKLLKDIQKAGFIENKSNWFMSGEGDFNKIYYLPASQSI